MGKTVSHQGFMTGELLVAMPQMRDARFTRSVIYICAHTSDGAMGLVVNRLVGSLTFPDLLQQLNIDSKGMGEHIRIRSGGPGLGSPHRPQEEQQNRSQPKGCRKPPEGAGNPRSWAGPDSVCFHGTAGIIMTR
jgi:hypothetical protein